MPLVQCPKCHHLIEFSILLEIRGHGDVNHHARLRPLGTLESLGEIWAWIERMLANGKAMSRTELVGRLADKHVREEDAHLILEELHHRGMLQIGPDDFIALPGRV